MNTHVGLDNWGYNPLPQCCVSQSCLWSCSLSISLKVKATSERDSSPPINARRCQIVRFPCWQLHLAQAQVAFTAEKPQNNAHFNVFRSRNPQAIWRGTQASTSVSLLLMTSYLPAGGMSSLPPIPVALAVNLQLAEISWFTENTWINFHWFAEQGLRVSACPERK